MLSLKYIIDSKKHHFWAEVNRTSQFQDDLLYYLFFSFVSMMLLLAPHDNCTLLRHRLHAIPLTVTCQGNPSAEMILSEKDLFIPFSFIILRYRKDEDLFNSIKR